MPDVVLWSSLRPKHLMRWVYTGACELNYLANPHWCSRAGGLSARESLSVYIMFMLLLGFFFFFCELTVSVIFVAQKLVHVFSRVYCRVIGACY